MDRAVTMADIGKELGVSTVTVSKALSGKKGISEKLRAKIIETAGKMGYKRPEHRLPKEENLTIGVIVGERYLDDQQSFYWQLYQDIVMYLSEEGYIAVIEVVSGGDEKERRKPSLFMNTSTDGVIILGTFQNAYEDRLLEWAGENRPVVMLDTGNGDRRCDAVVGDNLRGGYVMTDHLFRLGHTRIGFVGTLHCTDSIDERFLGYCSACLQHNVPIQREWVVDDRDPLNGRIYEDMGERFPKGKLPSAFFCNCDQTANILITGLRRQGYRVPEDISVAGYDNYGPDQTAGIRMTTYETDMRGMAWTAVQRLLHRIRTASADHYMTCLIPGRLIVGDSAVRIGDPVPSV